MSEITLYGYPTSPFVMKVACYLDFKKLDYAFVPVNPVSPTQIKFTNQRLVPVLKIGEEWRTESSELGWWLDELYPKNSLDSEDDNESFKIRDLDDWVSNTLIPARFREAIDWVDPVTSIRNGWILARVVNSGTPLPLHIRLLWPFFVRKAPFIVKMVNDALDRKEGMFAMRARVLDEFEAHLGKGPYLGGLKDPSLADFSAYPIFISSWLMGMHGDFAWRRRPAILAWMQRVQAHLPVNPLPCKDAMIKRKFPWETVKHA